MPSLGAFVGILLVLHAQVSYKIVYCKPLLFKPLNRVKLDNATYLQMRQKILATEQLERVGGQIVLTDKEKQANDILMAAKHSEVDASLLAGKPFPPSINFLQAKPAIDASKVFQIIRMMPKGGALHTHDVSIASPTWLIKNVTYRSNCYMCYDSNSKISFHFYQTPPANPGCPWKLVSDYRQQSGNATAFDETIIKSLSLADSTVGQDINAVWKAFEEALERVEALVNFSPVFGDYYQEALREFNADNVQYIEVRALLAPLYNLDGTSTDTKTVLEIYKKTTDQFLQQNPGFSGANIIKTNVRFRPPSDIMADVKASIQMRKDFPDFFAGYDLVGQEDPGKPLLYYLDALLYPSQQSPPANLPYFFHAGETDWQGTKVDDNLIDAVLLNSTRIGHGYALNKHPDVLKVVKDKQIAIEVNPISNQVLKLVDDLRNHPASMLIDQGYPVVISCDDPATWGATGLSYDFYEAFMALSGRDDDIKVLKQLAINSLSYSAMSTKAKVAALRMWEQKWDAFINKVILMYSNGSSLVG